jgi:uncharacterized protein YndB with AHSA1/START domain
MSKKVERTITIAASPERVWQAWVEEMNNWWTRPYYNDHERVTGLYLEPRLGGRYIEKWGDDGAGFLIGHVVEWLPPFRLAYTWSERNWGGITTLVQIELRPEGAGTRLSIVHDGFERLPDSEQQHAGYDYGQGDLLGKFKAYIEKTGS